MTRTAVLSLALAGAVLSTAARAQPPERLPPVPPASYDSEQKAAAAAFEAARKGGAPYGPFVMLMRSPDLMTAARSLGDYLRYKSAVGNTLSEFVILITARHWSQDYAWNIHQPIALKQGIAKAKIDAIAEGRRPEGMTDDEAICYDFSTELQQNKQVSDATYARALKRFGEKGVVDLTGITGYYTLLSMEMNMARTAPGGPLHLKRMPE